METNVLGLPSLTGYTPLKAYQKGQVLKYDFKGVGPVVVDKSGHGNLGRLKPRDDPPRRKIRSFFPLKVVMEFDGENDYIEVGDKNVFDLGAGSITVIAQVSTNSSDVPRQGVVTKRRRHWRDREGWSLSIHYGALRASLCDGSNLVKTKRVPINPNELYRTSFTANGDNSILKLYVNKELYDSVDYTGLTKRNITTGHPLRIGWFSDYLSGKIGNVRIYNRALSEDEIKET